MRFRPRNPWTKLHPRTPRSHRSKAASTESDQESNDGTELNEKIRKLKAGIDEVMREELWTTGDFQRVSRKMLVECSRKIEGFVKAKSTESQPEAKPFSRGEPYEKSKGGSMLQEP